MPTNLDPRYISSPAPLTDEDAAIAARIVTNLGGVAGRYWKAMTGYDGCSTRAIARAANNGRHAYSATRSIDWMHHNGYADRTDVTY